MGHHLVLVPRGGQFRPCCRSQALVRCFLKARVLRVTIKFLQHFARSIGRPFSRWLRMQTSLLCLWELAGMRWSSLGHAGGRASTSPTAKAEIFSVSGWSLRLIWAASWKRSWLRHPSTRLMQKSACLLKDNLSIGRTTTLWKARNCISLSFLTRYSLHTRLSHIAPTAIIQGPPPKAASSQG